MPGPVIDLTTKSSFTKEALADLPPAGEFVTRLREQAFLQFDAAPIPSQETEEWRYTDLSDFDFDFAPFVHGGPWADSLDQVPEEIQAAAGQIGDRAGLQIQRNSEVILSREGRVAQYDLLDSMRAGKVKLESLKAEELPADMQKMSLKVAPLFVLLSASPST